MPLTNPTAVFDFTAFGIAHPNSPPPGDRLTAQFENHRVSINEIIATLNALGTHLVTLGDMDPSVLASFQASISNLVQPLVNAAAGSATTATTQAATATTQAATATAAAANAVSAAALVNAAANGVINGLNVLKAQAEAELAQVVAASGDAANDANDAQGWANLAQDYANVCQAWAEYMPGTIPPNILAVMGITGDHWSARWWANQTALSGTAAQNAATQAANSAAAAAASASQAATSAANAHTSEVNAATSYTSFAHLYLGNHTSDPALDNQGNALIPGALYFNTTSNQMRNWNGTAWQNLAGGAGIADAPADGNAYARKNNAWANLSGLVAGVPEAPNDGQLYARKSLAWQSFVIPTIPATYDSDHVVNLSAVTGATVTAALNAVNATAGSKLSDAPNDANTYARKAAAWIALPDFTTFGDVKGPAGGVVDGEFSLYSGVTGTRIKGSGVTYDGAALNLPAGRKYRIGGNDLAYADLASPPWTLASGVITSANGGTAVDILSATDNTAGGGPYLQLSGARGDFYIKHANDTATPANGRSVLFMPMGFTQPFNGMQFWANKVDVRDAATGATVYATIDSTGINLPSAGETYKVNGAQLGYGNGLAGFGTAAAKSTGTTTGTVPLLDAAGTIPIANGGTGATTATAARAALNAEQLGTLNGVNTQTGAAYTLAASDAGQVVETNNAAANTVTIAANATTPIPVNSRVDIVQYGAGQTTIVAASGVTIRNKYGLKLSGQYAAVSLYKRATDEWVAFGDTTT